MGLRERRGKTGEWRKLHNEELIDLLVLIQLFSDDKIGNEISWACSVHGGEERRGVHKVLVGRREGRIPLGRP